MKQTLPKVTLVWTHVGLPHILRRYHCLQLVKYFLSVPWIFCIAQTLGLQETKVKRVTWTESSLNRFTYCASINQINQFDFLELLLMPKHHILSQKVKIRTSKSSAGKVKKKHTTYITISFNNFDNTQNWNTAFCAAVQRAQK